MERMFAHFSAARLDSIDLHCLSLADDTRPTGQGCFADDASDRDLPEEVTVDALNPEKCITACKDSNYRYAGVQVCDYNSTQVFRSVGW